MIHAYVLLTIEARCKERQTAQAVSSLMTTAEMAVETLAYLLSSNLKQPIAKVHFMQFSSRESFKF
jgi:endonuclease III